MSQAPADRKKIQHLYRTLAQADATFASETKNNVMRNTEYDLEKLASMISSESSFTALMEIMGDMGLEFESAVKSA